MAAKMRFTPDYVKLQNTTAPNKLSGEFAV